MPTGDRWSSTRRAAIALSLLPWLLAGCANLGAVRDFGRSAAATTAYPQAATAYVDSAATSAPYLVASAPGLVDGAARRAQVRDALALHAEVGRYFELLARLAGEDEATLANLKSMGSDVRSIAGGSMDRATIDAYASLGRTLASFAEQPARERAVKALVTEGGPSAMRLVAALRSIAGDWRAQVGNDARQVDATLEVATLPADVAPLVRMLAADRRAELARGYAVTLRKMRAAETALASVEAAHAEMAAHLDELQGEAVRERLQRAGVELRLAVDAEAPPH